MDYVPPGSLCPWDFPGENTGEGCHALLQGIFPTQRLNPGLMHCRQMLLPSEKRGKPNIFNKDFKKWFTSNKSQKKEKIKPVKGKSMQGGQVGKNTL